MNKFDQITCSLCDKDFHNAMRTAESIGNKRIIKETHELIVWLINNRKENEELFGKVF